MSLAIAQPSAAPSRTRVIAAVSIGNALEYYDLAIYTFVAVTIGKLIFPAQEQTSQVLLSLGIYGTGYFARPLGGIVIGTIGDRRGRKLAVNLTLFLMAFGTLMIGLAPTYEQAGILAPIIVLAGRLIQGFSAGGETGASTTLLAESAPDDERGYFSSWQGASQGLAAAFGALLMTCLNLSLPADAMASWGWRIPFILGIAIVPVGLYLRRAIDETLDMESRATAKTRNPVGEIVSLHWSRAMWGLLALLGGNAAYVTLNLYLPTYGVRELNLSPAATSTAALAGGITIFLTSPIGGVLADRWGRRESLLFSRIAIIVAAWPAFLIITAYPTLPMLIANIVILSALQGLGTGFFIAMVENFPKNVRVTGLSATYALGVVLSGGFGQMIVTWLIEISGSKLAPAFYVIGIGLVSLIGVLNLSYFPIRKKGVANV
jgi:MFS transporter, MHS family, proline/betaine transporter